jgi:hypothetical protein
MIRNPRAVALPNPRLATSARPNLGQPNAPGRPSASAGTNIIFAGVDGTGPEDDGEYSRAMAHSFVNYLRRNCNASASNIFYRRGPTLWGNQTGPLGAAAAQFVRRRKALIDEPRIVLAGYSRGGAAVITAAQILALRLIGVDLMILFDAVDRSVTAAAGTIPPNVSKVYHLRRSWRAFSRPYFGNCGTTYVPFATTYIERFFRCTHGGVGGCPWWNQPDRDPSKSLGDRIWEDGIPTAVTYEEDLDGSRTAWQWISQHLAAEGVL